MAKCTYCISSRLENNLAQLERLAMQSYQRSVIVLNLNGEPFLRDCLVSLRLQTAYAGWRIPMY